MTIETDLIWMSLCIFVPSIFALGLLFFPKGTEEWMRWWSLLGTAVTFLISACVFINFWFMLDFKRDNIEGKEEIVRPSADSSLAERSKKADDLFYKDGKFLKNPDDQLARYPWIAKFNIDYFIGIDGISMAMILLTTVLFFLSMIASWGIEKHVKGYCMLFLVLETGVLGTFFALDFFLFYIFWEVMLLPMYFLIGIWGGPRREYAAIKFFLYTLFGSVFILIALLGFYFTDVQDFVHQDIVTSKQNEVTARFPDMKPDVQIGKAAVAKPNDDWAPFTDATKSFSVLLPGKPDMKEQKVKGIKGTVKEYTLKKGDVAYSVSFVNLADKKKSAEEVLNGARDGMAKAAGGKIESEKPIALGKYGGREIVLSEPKGPGHAVAHLLVVDNRMYTLVVAGELVTPTSPEAKTFFASFNSVAIQKAQEVAAQKHLELEKKVQVHSFDLLVLARAGMAAMQWNKLDSASAKTKYIEDFVEKRASEGVTTSAEAVRGRFESQALFTPTFQIVMFIFLFVGFAIKVPVFPFHTWLPDAHVEAPTPISMILAGILLKLGGYGIIRIAYPLCPWAANYLAWIICVFAMINIVYGAFAAMAQTDFKKLVAYSSISHMGYVILGIAVWPEVASPYWAWGMNGAMYQMIAHGISSAGMFFCVGVIYDRAHHRNLDNFRGLNEPMPLYGGISAVIFFAALGLPGLCGFVGEFFVILSTWNFSTPAYPHAGKVFAVLAALTVVITAAYILWTLQRVYLGTNPAYKDYKDITLRELLCIIPLVVLAVVLGVVPMLVLQWMEPHVTGLVDTLMQAKM